VESWSLGGLYGSLIYVPLLFNVGWLNLRVLNGSVYYESWFIGEELIPKNLYFVVYALGILLTLLILPKRLLNHFGNLILLSVVVTEILFNYVFISVCCFFAAIISLYLTYLINQITQFKPS
jgi:hypothetical protein